MAIYVLTNVLWLLGGTEMEEEGSLEAGVTIEARDANAAGLTQAETWGGGRGKACRKEGEGARRGAGVGLQLNNQENGFS